MDRWRTSCFCLTARYFKLDRTTGTVGTKFPFPQFEGHFKVVDYRWLKETHLKLKLALDQYSFDAIAFNAAGRFEFDPMRDHVHLVYEIDRNAFNGNVNLQLRIVYLNQ